MTAMGFEPPCTHNHRLCADTMLDVWPTVALGAAMEVAAAVPGQMFKTHSAVFSARYQRGECSLP